MTDYDSMIREVVESAIAQVALATLIAITSCGYGRSFSPPAKGHLELVAKQQPLPLEYKKRPKSRGSKRVSETKRQRVFMRDHYTCQICGQHYPEQHLVPNHIDHNIRHSNMNNLETTCAGCNMQEGMIYARLLREAGPRGLIPEEKRLQIVKEARRIAREQAPRKGWRSAKRSSSSVKN